jgi:hypothetical protein
LCTASGGCRALRRARARQGHAEGAAAGEAYKAKLASANERDRLAVDPAVKKIEAENASRAEAWKIIIAEQGAGGRR